MCALTEHACVLTRVHMIGCTAAVVCTDLLVPATPPCLPAPSLLLGVSIGRPWQAASRAPPLPCVVLLPLVWRMCRVCLPMHGSRWHAAYRRQTRSHLVRVGSVGGWGEVNPITSLG